MRRRSFSLSIPCPPHRSGWTRLNNMEADEFVATLSRKLKDDARIWGENISLSAGPVTFRRCARSATPVPVSSVYAVLGGVFSTDAHYELIESAVHRGRYDYVHRLSSYHLNPFTFRWMVEQTILRILSEWIQDDDQLDPRVETTKTGEALEFSNIRNGLSTPAWIVRLIPAVQGAGDPPRGSDGPTHSGRFSSTAKPGWLLLSPPRDELAYGFSWQISDVQSAWRAINFFPETARALSCILYEATAFEWVPSDDHDQFQQLSLLIASEMDVEDQSSSLTTHVRNLLLALREKLEDNYATKETVSNAVRCIDGMLNDSQLDDRLTKIEDNLRRYNLACHRNTHRSVTDSSASESNNEPLPSSIDHMTIASRDRHLNYASPSEDGRKANGTIVKHDTVVDGNCNYRLSKDHSSTKWSWWTWMIGILVVALLLVMFENKDVVKAQLSKISSSVLEDKEL